MILSEIKHYFQQQKCATLQQLCLRFQSDPDAMRGMLEQWQRKGRLRKELIKGCSKGCASCDSAEMEFYEWMN